MNNTILGWFSVLLTFFVVCLVNTNHLVLFAATFPKTQPEPFSEFSRDFQVLFGVVVKLQFKSKIESNPPDTVSDKILMRIKHRLMIMLMAQSLEDQF